MMPMMMVIMIRVRIIDVLFEKMVNVNIDLKMINKLYKYLKQEGFDTDGMKMDVIDHENKSNIIINTSLGDDKHNEKFNAFIVNYIEEQSRTLLFALYSLLSISTIILLCDICYIVSKFSTGYTWFYWPYYQNGNKKLHLFGNENNYGGFTEQQLYVPRKYETYKAEILSHDISKRTYGIILVKAEKLSNPTNQERISSIFKLWNIGK